MSTAPAAGRVGEPSLLRPLSNPGETVGIQVNSGWQLIDCHFDGYDVAVDLAPGAQNMLVMYSHLGDKVGLRANGDVGNLHLIGNTHGLRPTPIARAARQLFNASGRRR